MPLWHRFGRYVRNLPARIQDYFAYRNNLPIPDKNQVNPSETMGA